MTLSWYEYAYYSLVNIDTLRPSFFLVQTKNLEVYTIDFGISFLCGFTKYKIYTSAGPEFVEW